MDRSRTPEPRSGDSEILRPPGSSDTPGKTAGRPPLPTESNLPPRIVVGANGAYWRDFGDFYSMCPVSTDNDPVEVVAVYERVTRLPGSLDEPEPSEVVCLNCGQFATRPVVERDWEPLVRCERCGAYDWSPPPVRQPASKRGSRG